MYQWHQLIQASCTHENELWVQLPYPLNQLAQRPHHRLTVAEARPIDQHRFPGHIDIFG